MLDLFRMDMFRMRKMRAFIVIAIILIALSALNTYSSKLERDMYKEDLKEKADSIVEEMDSQNEDESDDDSTRIGMVIDSALEDLSKPYIDQMFASFVAGMFPALMIVIFTVLYVNADSHTGFIKSIGGQMCHRWQITVSKLICVVIYSGILLIYVAGLQAVMNLLFFGEANIYDWEKFMMYILLGFLMNSAFAIFAAFITTLFRSNLIGIIICVLDVLGMFSILSYFVNMLIKRLFDYEFDLNKYMLSFCLSKVKYGSTFDSLSHQLIVAACFAVVSIAGSIFVFNKRDIA
ncbi:MAG: hypothetical protein IKO44_02705 [Ruminococcus sp.]|nr:hypothetical protein [Ruminococcus sp.]